MRRVSPRGSRRPAAPVRNVPLGRRLRGLVRDRRGSSAVEFALVAFPFLALTFAILQTAFLIWATQNFDHALQKAARSLLTGDFQNANRGQTDQTTLLNNLRANLCGPASTNKVVLFDCDGVKLDVAVTGSFGASPVRRPLDAGTRTWATGFGSSYACANPGQIVTVTAAVSLKLAFNILNLGMNSFADGSRLLTSTAVFRTEPYNPTVGTTSC